MFTGGAAVKGEQCLTKSAQFGLVYDRGGSWRNRAVVVRTLPNGLSLSRYGFAVSKRVGKAVVRNLVKRRLREILKQTPLKPGWDIVIIARVAAAREDYAGLREAVGGLLLRAGLTAGENEGVSPGVN